VEARAPRLAGDVMRVVALVGPMGSGKTEVGRMLARRLGWSFIDTDAEIVAGQRRPIADIFRTDGERGFREMERAVVRSVVRGRNRVVATGGGAVLSAATRRALRDAGPVFWLTAPVDVLLQRVGKDAGRPLLGADPRASLERLLRERDALYADAGEPIDAAPPIGAVVDSVLRALSAMQETVRVDLGARSYDIKVGAGTLALLGHELHTLGARGRVVIITDRGLMRRFGLRAVEALEGCGFDPLPVTVPAGERAKSLRRASAVIDALAAAGVNRAHTIVALGGGVVGDLAGFVAGVFMRGIRFVQAPTTLLAQIDSSIGGKTAVNHDRAKNLIGVYHQPALVLSDVDTLASLPSREVRAGLAEAVKYGMILDPDLFAMLERDGPQIIGAAPGRELAAIVARCAATKARVVALDEIERGPREILNYGHTVGHGIEAAIGGALVHGEAIAIGMTVEVRVAQRLGLADAALHERQTRLLETLGLPTRVPQVSTEAVLDAMRLDKKRREGRIRCSLPEGIGRMRLGVDVPVPLLEEVIDACRESS
jgi:shikimate kinase/3-dehydroquinate synthase